MNYLRLLTAVLTLLLSLNFALAQEAVVEPTPIIPAKEKAKEEKTEKEAKEKPAPEKKSIRETMSPVEFKAAGLDKLSKEELKNLDAKLHGVTRSEEHT